MPASRKLTEALTAARLKYRRVPRTTTASDPDKYTKHPHEYAELIRPDKDGRKKLGGELQRDLLYWVEFEHIGRNASSEEGRVERHEWAKLSLSHLAELTGADRKDVSRALKDMAQRGIIQIRGREGLGDNIEKMYRITPDKWKTAPAYIPPKPRCRPRVETAAEESTEPAEATVEPGQTSKPQRVEISPTRGAEPVMLRIVFEPVECQYPVSISYHPGANGFLKVRCRVITPHRSAVCSPTETPLTSQNKQVADYSDFLTQFVLKFWGKSLDKSLLDQIVTAANGAPIANFENVVMSRFKKRGGNHSTGLLIELAGDAHRAWMTAQRFETADRMRRGAQEARQRQFTEEELADMERKDKEPVEVMAKAKCGKCKGTGKGKEVWQSVGGTYGPRPTKCAECGGSGDAPEMKAASA